MFSHCPFWCSIFLLVVSKVPWHDQPDDGEDGESSEDDESSGEVNGRGDAWDGRFDSTNHGWFIRENPNRCNVKQWMVGSGKISSSYLESM